MRLIKKTINRQKTEIKRVELNKSPEVVLEFISNPTFKEKFWEFVEEVLSWEGEKKNELKETSIK